MLEHSFYDACLCADFGGDGCAGTVTLRTFAVSETTLRSGVRWDSRTGDFGVSSDGDVG